jgi:UDP-4-amino-4,6-dideoxy-N-acetyl-beta-L-altrosamine N-acetyltransferase
MWIFKDYKLLSREEHEKILTIRNEISIRESSKNSTPISLEDHLNWVESLTKNQNYFTLFIDGTAVGGLNFTHEKSCITNWGIFFSKNSQPLIASLATYIFIEYMLENYASIKSEVIKSNKQALRFNNYFGITIINEDKTLYHLMITPEIWKDQKEKLKALSKRVQMTRYKFEKA